MDRKIERKGFLRKKHLKWVVGGVAMVALLVWILFADHRRTLRVDGDSITIAEAEKAEFKDYVRVGGVVQPIEVVQLTPLEGGIVEERLVEEGSSVHKGDIIVKLSNPQLNIQILESEASLAEKENFLRNTRVQMEQERLNLRRERLTLEIALAQKKRAWERNDKLFAEALISKEEYLLAKEEYELAERTVELVAERQVQDSIFRALQVDNMERNLESMRRNMDLVRQRVENLEVKSAIDGELGMLDVVLGESVMSGHKLGQVNDLSDYKIETLIDEHYIDRVHVGLTARFERGDEEYALEVKKVFPEVRNGQFRVWLTFGEDRPENIRTGQTYYVNLELGESEVAVVIPRGAFFAATGGNWIFVVEDGKAERRDIRITRQNPQQYEVEEGLTAGEKVIVSGYDRFEDIEILTIDD